MKLQQLFPTILILLDIVAGLVYLCDGDLRKFVYWTSAAVLTATVTF
jgi:hypothetical protein